MTYAEQLAGDQQAIENALQRFFLGDVPYATLYNAMRYSLLAGGKRIRPVLVLEACRACGGDWEKAMNFACALEMIHTYSLIHDDLPCMDNDDYRRGRLTNHKVYGEDIATLAGDGLLTAAFGVAAGMDTRRALSDRQVVDAIEVLALCAGENGMVAGQVLDLQWEAEPKLAMEQLELIHHHKTGALLRCAVELGCIAAAGTEAQSAALREFAAHIGLAFQIRDDILDVVGTQQEMGKPVGSDADNRKTTYVTLLGLEESQALVLRHTEGAKAALKDLPDSGFLCWLADELAGRIK